MLDTIFLIAAIIGGTILTCQFLLSLIGLGHDGGDVATDGGDFSGDAHFGGDAGGDFHGDAHVGADVHDGVGADHDGGHSNYHSHANWLFSVLTFRTLVAAMAFFGIAGKAALSAGYREGPSLVAALVVGGSAMYGTYWLMRFIATLSSSGNESIRNAVGCPARVYVPIPAARAGAGKVQLTLQNRIVEYLAVTDDAERLKTGQAVRVVGVAGSDVVRVSSAVEVVPA